MLRQALMASQAAAKISGPGTGAPVTALWAPLSNGEYVVQRAAAVRKYGSHMLDSLNGMRRPSMQKGGLIASASAAPVASST